MEPLDVTPLRTDPATIADPVRRRVHADRYDAQRLADDARSDVLDAMTRVGIGHADAARLADALIMAVRVADASRLEYARNTIRDVGAWWPGIGDLNGAVDFLRITTHAHPVQPTTTTTTTTNGT